MGSVKKTPAGTTESSVDWSFTIAYPFVLRAAVLLKVPDIIQSAGPGAALSATEICTHLPNPERTSPRNLERILECLTCYGILRSTVEEIEKIGVKKYALTSLGEDLTREEVTSFLQFMSAPELIQIWPSIHQTVLNPDEVVFEKIYGKGVYQYLKEDVPELGKFHVRMMERMSAMHVESLLEHYDDELRSLTGILVDVGGSQGAVAAVIASKYPNIQRVINFDLPHIVSGAPAILGVEHVGGSFLDFVPQGDFLILKFVVLNWSDEEAVKLLRNCYNALPAKGKAIIVDRVKPDSEEEDNKARLRMAVQDLMSSLAFKGGKQRTLKELQSMAKAAGFARLQIVKVVDGTLNFIQADKT